jgi:hypothetical protein
MFSIEIKRLDGSWWRLQRRHDTTQGADRFVTHFRGLGWTARIVPSNS